MRGPYSQHPRDKAFEASLKDLHRRMRMVESKSILHGEMTFSRVRIGAWVIEETYDDNSRSKLIAYLADDPATRVDLAALAAPT